MRLLFDVSKETLVNMLNGLFGEEIDPGQVEITKANAKFADEQLHIIEGDLFLRLNEPAVKPKTYHIEFQTNEDGTMAIRVLRYDFSKAVEEQNLSGDRGEIILYMPRSLVIHIEPHKNIPDEYSAVIVFADGETKRYSVPVLKYWELTDEQIIGKGLVPLLPLKIFLMREELERLAKGGTAKERRAAMHRAQGITEQTAKKAKELYDDGRLTDADYGKVRSAMAYLFMHLNKRYEGDKSLNEGVKSMLEVIEFRDPMTVLREVEKKGEKRGEKRGEKNNAKKTAKKMLAKNKPLDEIMEFTELTAAEIAKIVK